MLLKSVRWYALPFFLSFFLAFPVVSQAQTLKRKAGFNQNWKFFKGDPGITTAATAFNDSAWTTVNIPHSASYDSIVYSSEVNFYQGNCWYRKSFTVPANAKKVLIEFEGAMQTADLWINGDTIGRHDNSGYTPFSFDITSHVVRGATNVLALRLNNVKSSSIPPGCTGSAPDFLLFGGLSRSVWLRFKDSVYIPINSQQVMTPNASASNAIVRSKTPVMNDAASAKTAEVTMNVFDAAHVNISSTSLSQTIPAHTKDTFDISSYTIAAPHLWSPSSPYLYSVQTLVKVNGAVVDSVVEPCGVRWFSWSATTGFSLNGARYEIKGMCVHQFFGWIGNAVPDSRFYQEIKVLKDMGCNSIRCSHYPRAQAFYDACDKLGILLYVEQPSWGWGLTPTAACWARMDSCVKEMVESGRNHPSIYLWGLYNEPKVGSDFTANITVLNNRAHSLDSTRPTAMANISGFSGAVTVPDIVGLNYSTSINYTSNGINASTKPWLNTETRTNFYPPCFRGSPLDLDTTSVRNSSGNAAEEWAIMNYTTATTGQLAGGHFWCFKDYNSGANTNGFEGVVDRYTVPKVMYYMFRKNWTGAAPDYPRPGTATTIELKSDTNRLIATGADVFLITAAMRDGAGHQISSDNGNVVFTVSPAGSATFFGGNNVLAMGGRAAAYLRTTTSYVGPITITATYPGRTTIPAATITVTTLANPAETFVEGAVGIKSPSFQQIQVNQFKLTYTSTAKGIIFHCPAAAGQFSIVNSQGKTLFTRNARKDESVLVTHRMLGAGLLFGVWNNGEKRIVSRVIAAN